MLKRMSFKQWLVKREKEFNNGYWTYSDVKNSWDSCKAETLEIVLNTLNSKKSKTTEICNIIKKIQKL